jgi:hypothetical protein
MTHDELLARLDLSNEHLIPYDEFEKRNSALRAIVEMCKPSDWDNDDNFYWKKAILEMIGRELN